jgi:hypothetical protein
MRKGVVATSSVGVACLVLSFGAGTAFAQTQPADLGNVANIERGASAPGPHCHFVLPAAGKGPFANIISGAAHQGHTETGLPAGVFQATTCPEPISQ